MSTKHYFSDTASPNPAKPQRLTLDCAPELEAYAQVWSPLLAHINALAQSLPERERLRAVFRHGEAKNSVVFQVLLEQNIFANDPEEPFYNEKVKWFQTKDIGFYKNPYGLFVGLITERLTLKDVFLHSATNPFAFVEMGIMNTDDPKLDHVQLHPARMSKAIDILEHWFAKVTRRDQKPPQPDCSYEDRTRSFPGREYRGFRSGG